MIETAVATPEVRIPWGAWRGDSELALTFPLDWTSVLLRPADGPELDDATIGGALDAPVGAARLNDLAVSGRTVAIAIDDLSRPVPSSRVLVPLVDRLAAAGIRERDITIVVGSGAHRAVTRQDLERKVGVNLLSRVNAVGHDPRGALADTGVTLADVPVRLNEAFYRADIRIGVSGVLPHPFAGFSGGGKIVIPGLADLDVLARTHKYALMGLRGGGGLDGNRFRTDMERAVREIGLHWSVNVVTNSRRQVTFVAAGDLVAAHRAAAAAARHVAATTAPEGLLDALIVNAYPKDTELLQIEGALVALRSGMLSWLTPSAPIVLAGASSDGLGTHGLFGAGGRLFRVPSPKTFLGGRPLIVFSPGATADDAATLFWPGYPFCRTWSDVITHVRSHVPTGARVGVVPCGPLQLASGVAS
jgi:nickel-dependent lactate racemase